MLTEELKSTKYIHSSLASVILGQSYVPNNKNTKIKENLKA